MDQTLQALPEQMIYALDIGTRTVVGVIGSYQDDRFVVAAHAAIGHPERAMYDGQIHDIEKVSKVVKQVTASLEQQTGYALKKVAIAAAGRALKTQRTEIIKSLDPTREIDKRTLDAIEIEGIQQAQKQLEKSGDVLRSKYYCVGYSVVQYELDEALIGNPLEHRGSLLKVNVIATFLPHSVVDSLYTVVDKLGLEVVNLTLEPIAAISVAIPQKFRLLNLALVDIGAGTSDIALTKNGAVFSYAMVDVAGDELTETLVQRYLLDFDSAENLKINLCKEDEQRFTDVVGIPYTLPTHEILSTMTSEINRIGAKIAEGIIAANGGVPSAVFLIGGGCQVPGFSQCLAEHLDLPKERVVIKGASALEGIDYLTTPFEGPEFITPLGIGYAALKDREQDFLQVQVNDTPLRLFNSRQMMVSDALVLIGYNARRLIPERGKAISYTLNDQPKRVPGGHGEAAKVFVNGAAASLDTPIKHKDAIIIEDAIHGDDARVYICDIIDLKRQVYLDDGPLPLVRQITINGEPLDLLSDGQRELQHHDQIMVEALNTVGDLMVYKSLSDAHQLQINGRRTHPSITLKHGDLVTVELVSPAQRAQGLDSGFTALSGGSSLADDFREITYEEDGIEDSPQSNNSIALGNSKPLNTYYLIINEAPVTIVTDRNPLIFVDIFEYIDFDLTKPQGIIDLLLNGSRARYTDELKNGDVINLGWRK